MGACVLAYESAKVAISLACFNKKMTMTVSSKMLTTDVDFVFSR